MSEELKIKKPNNLPYKNLTSLIKNHVRSGVFLVINNDDSERIETNNPKICQYNLEDERLTTKKRNYDIDLSKNLAEKTSEKFLFNQRINPPDTLLEQRNDYDSLDRKEQQNLKKNRSELNSASVCFLNKILPPDTFARALYGSAVEYLFVPASSKKMQTLNWDVERDLKRQQLYPALHNFYKKFKSEKGNEVIFQYNSKTFKAKDFRITDTSKHEDMPLRMTRWNEVNNLLDLSEDIFLEKIKSFMSSWAVRIEYKVQDENGLRIENEQYSNNKTGLTQMWDIKDKKEGKNPLTIAGEHTVITKREVSKEDDSKFFHERYLAIYAQTRMYAINLLRELYENKVENFAPFDENGKLLEASKSFKWNKAAKRILKIFALNNISATQLVDLLISVRKQYLESAGLPMIYNNPDDHKTKLDPYTQELLQKDVFENIVGISIDWKKDKNIPNSLKSQVDFYNSTSKLLKDNNLLKASIDTAYSEIWEEKQNNKQYPTQLIEKYAMETSFLVNDITSMMKPLGNEYRKMIDRKMKIDLFLWDKQNVNKEKKLVLLKYVNSKKTEIIEIQQKLDKYKTISLKKDETWDNTQTWFAIFSAAQDLQYQYLTPMTDLIKEIEDIFDK